MYPLVGAQLKAYWAGKDVDTLHKEIGAFLKEDARRILDKYEPQLGAYVRYVFPGSDARTEWSLLLGDIAHNYRSCLDHIAWQLAIANSPTRNPKDQWKANDISFPIYTCRRKYLRKRHSAWRHQGLSSTHRRLIRHFQPYQRRDAPEAHPLWHLHELSNIDKHQVLHTTLVAINPAIPKPGKLSKKILDPETGEFEMVYEAPEGMPGATMEVILRPGGPSEGDVELKGDPVFQVEVEQPGTILHEQPVLRLVDSIRTEVEAVLAAFVSSL
jgi:hypothetical protein